jgi:hypothetical protein
MENTLFQKRNFASRKFILDKQYLSIEHKSWKEEKSWKVRLDKIGNQKYYVKESNNPKILSIIIIGTIFISCTILYIFFNKHTRDNTISTIIIDSVVVLFGLLFIFKKVNNDINIIGGEQTLTFYNDTKNEKELNEFIDYVIQSANKYILDKYGKIDSDLPEETQLNILRWLKDRELINDKEYDSLKQEYKMKKII